MYAVIFKAKIKQFDQHYSAMAEKLRQLALNEFGCTEFFSVSDNGVEVAISYWPSLQSIQAWKDHPEHQEAQRLGQSCWYVSYQVQVVEVLREYNQ